MQMCTEAALNNITNSIKDTALSLFDNRLNSVILYGSYARGTNDSESDIDIMLLIDMPAESINKYRSEISRAASRLSLDSADCVTVSVVLQDTETFEKFKSALPFYRNVAEEGVVVYAA